jgi:hypothetical protein
MKKGCCIDAGARCPTTEPRTSRPRVCRDYPVNLTYDVVPSLFPECSYSVQDKKAEQLSAALKAAGLSGEKLAEVEKRLFLTKKGE